MFPVPDKAVRVAPHASGEEPLPGYRLLEPLGRGGFGEVWKCEAPGGLHKAIKFVSGGQSFDRPNGNAEQELRAMDRIKAIRHPFLLSTERIELVGQELLIVMELADRSLHDLLGEYRDRGQMGIPRWELVGYLREAAEVLDLLNLEYGVKHLDIKPRNIFLVGKHIKVADFGLAASLAELNGPEGRRGGLTPLYAAPETFKGQVTLFTDQYSLAATYVELLTGSPPFTARNLNQLIMQVCGQPPDLKALPPEDRVIVGRALAKEPRERYASCLEFLDELDVVSAPETLPARKAGSTSYEFSLDELATTPGSVSSGSGLYRRRSRILPAVRTTAPPPVAETLSGFQLIDSLGRGPAGELWRARNSKGDFCLLRFIALPSGSPEVPFGLERVLGLRHEHLPRMQVLAAGPERIALITPMGQSSLWERFRECHGTGMPGIPRNELLVALTAYASALDELYHEHELQHLLLTPRHLVQGPSSRWLLEFGMAECWWLPQNLQPAQLSPRYSAPELFESLVSDACDQYSLALLYQELLVGLHPFRNLNARQMANPRLRGVPDVSLLPGPDRPVVMQALSNDPTKRFRSCREFLLALEESGQRGQSVVISPSASHQAGLRPTPVPETAPTATPSWREPLNELLANAGRGQEMRSAGLIHYRLAPAQHLEQRAVARLPAGMVKLKLEGFREQWQATEVSRSDRRVVYQLQSKSNLWDRCLGRAPGLQVEVRIGTTEAISGLSPVRIRLDPIDCNRTRAEQMLGELGPTLLSSLQTYLHTQSEKAAQERFPLTQQITLQPPGVRPIVATLRDVGREGLCLISPEPVAVGPLQIQMNQWASPVMMSLPGRVVDCFTEERTFEVEIRLG
jgi:serine/threonine protein kinase